MSVCRVNDEFDVEGIPSLVLENGHIRVVVLVGKGTDIYEFRDKSSDTDVLWKTPWGVVNPKTHVPDTPSMEASFLDFYHGGWQELFPNAGSNCTYRGAELGVHGEVCKIPWDYRIQERHAQRVSVKFWVRTLRTPFLVEKTLTVEAGKPTLFIEESVTNEGVEPIDFMWGHHPAVGMPFLCEHCRLFVPASAVESVGSGAPQEVFAPNVRFESFPIVQAKDGKDFDLSRILPASQRMTQMGFLTDLKDGWWAIVNEKSRLGFAMRWDLAVFRHIWLWEELCGTPGYPWWGRCYVVGIEPHSSLSRAGLEGAVQAGTQLSLEPGARLSTWLCATSFLAEGEPSGVDDDGEIQY